MSGVRVTRRQGGLTVLAAACLALVFAPATAVAGLTGSGGELDATQDALDVVVSDEEGPPGVSAVIQRGKRVSFLRAGVADVRSNRAIHRTDHFRIASTAKAFSGGVAFSLVGEGLIDLDDTVGELLPGRYPNFAPVTVAQLLHHTSGVPTYTSDPSFQAQFSADPRGYISPEEIVGFVADDPLSFEPGNQYFYSNTDNILIGLIAQEVTGKLYPNVLRQRVYRPLELRQTSLPSGTRCRRGTSTATTSRPGSHPRTSRPRSALGDLGLGRNRLDAAGRQPVHPRVRWGATSSTAHFSASSSTSSRRRRADPKGPGENAAGLAVFRYRTECGTVFGHTGNIPGYTQFMAATKDGRNSVVVSATEQLSAEGASRMSSSCCARPMKRRSARFSPPLNSPTRHN